MTGSIITLRYLKMVTITDFNTRIVKYLTTKTLLLCDTEYHVIDGCLIDSEYNIYDLENHLLIPTNDCEIRKIVHGTEHHVDFSQSVCIQKIYVLYHDGSLIMYRVILNRNEKARVVKRELIAKDVSDYAYRSQTLVIMRKQRVLVQHNEQWCDLKFPHTPDSVILIMLGNITPIVLDDSGDVWKLNVTDRWTKYQLPKTSYIYPISTHTFYALSDYGGLYYLEHNGFGKIKIEHMLKHSETDNPIVSINVHQRLILDESGIIYTFTTCDLIPTISKINSFDIEIHNHL